MIQPIPSQISRFCTTQNLRTHRYLQQCVIRTRNRIRQMNNAIRLWLKPEKVKHVLHVPAVKLCKCVSCCMQRRQHRCCCRWRLQERSCEREAILGGLFIKKVVPVWGSRCVVMKLFPSTEGLELRTWMAVTADAKDHRWEHHPSFTRWCSSRGNINWRIGDLITKHFVTSGIYTKHYEQNVFMRYKQTCLKMTTTSFYS